MRYAVTLLATGLLVAVALKSRTAKDDDASGEPQGQTVTGARPNIERLDVPGGTHLKVSYRFAGAVSRARLVYEIRGEEHTVQELTDCERARTETERDGGYTTSVELDGVVPRGATRVAVVLEDETGTRIVPVPLS